MAAPGSSSLFPSMAAHGPAASSSSSVRGRGVAAARRASSVSRCGPDASTTCSAVPVSPVYGRRRRGGLDASRSGGRSGDADLAFLLNCFCLYNMDFSKLVAYIVNNSINF
ncbi:hypothetical protein VPH35_086205 [Triticum aestivum]|uniref:Uncharacterized protein n=1 Tax=Triticum urartu TaxID=4572 RepID=A0A8R7ULF9_TRIUA